MLRAVGASHHQLHCSRRSPASLVLLLVFFALFALPLGSCQLRSPLDRDLTPDEVTSGELTTRGLQEASVRCLACHEAKKGAPLVEPHLEADLGCPTCHGPSLRHLAGGDPPAPTDRSSPPGETDRIEAACRSCHFGRDGKFDFNRYFLHWRAEIDEGVYGRRRNSRCRNCHRHEKPEESSAPDEAAAPAQPAEEPQPRKSGVGSGPGSG